MILKEIEKIFFSKNVKILTFFKIQKNYKIQNSNFFLNKLLKFSSFF